MVFLCGVLEAQPMSGTIMSSGEVTGDIDMIILLTLRQYTGGNSSDGLRNDTDLFKSHSADRNECGNDS